MAFHGSLSVTLTLTQLVIVTLVLLILPTKVYTLDIDEYCDSQRIPSSSNPIEYDPYKCDQTVGLYCNPYLGRCTCFVTDSDYSDYHERCVAKVGHPCKASPAFMISCVDNAICDEDTGFCHCKPKYVSNEFKTRCEPADPNMYVYQYNNNLGVRSVQIQGSSGVFWGIIILIGVWQGLAYRFFVTM